MIEGMKGECRQYTKLLSDESVGRLVLLLKLQGGQEKDRE